MIPLIRSLMLEILAIGRAAGYDIGEDEVDKMISNVRVLHKDKVKESKHVPSMLLDAREGRPMELEGVIGELVRMAEKGGVQAPVSISL
jgi:2-dehydropantoate 2-reductase